MPRNIVQGSVNKARVSLNFTSNPQLNADADAFGDDMVSISYGGEITTMLPTATGVVGSPNPYMEVTLSFKIVKTHPLCARMLAQIASNSNIGNVVVTPDSNALARETYQNGFFNTFESRSYAGKEPTVGFTIKAYYPINNDIYGV